MKEIFKALSIVLVALFAGCSSDETNAPATPGNGALVKIQAEMAGGKDSRANISVDGNTFSGSWEDGDAMGVLYSVPGSSAFQGAQRFVYDSSEFAFEGELPSGTGDWQYMAFYPHADVTGNTAGIPFGNLRTQQGNAFNSASDALVAEPLDFSNAERGQTDEGAPIKFSLSRLTSIFNLSVKGGADAGEKVRYILLTSNGSEQPLSAKSLDFDVSNMGADAALSEDEQSNVIALGFTSGTAPDANDLEAFFNVLPGNYDLTFDVITDAKRMGTVTVDRTGAPFVAGKLYKKDVSDMAFAKVDAPSFDWPGEDLNEVHEITMNDDDELTYSAAITINAPAGIAELRVDVTSEVLNNGVGLTSMNLFNEEVIHTTLMDIPFSMLNLDCTTQVQYKKSTVFDITALVPMILEGAEEGSLHTFEVHVTDLAGQETVQPLTFKAPVIPIVYNNDADLWANTASFTLENIPADASVSVQYKKSTESEWQTAIVNGDKTKAEITPEWGTKFTSADWTTPNTVLPYWRINGKTGVFAENTYDYKILVDGKKYAKQFKTGDGQTIPYGTMEESTLPCFVLQDASITSETWGSGNNKVLAECWLCQQADSPTGKCARLTSGTQNTVLGGNILTAGNLFFGQFEKEGTGGHVRFGQQYKWDARPTAMKLDCKVKVGKVNYTMKPTTKIAKDQPDKARIFVAIVDWSSRHTVSSSVKVGLGSCTGSLSGSWDPENTLDPGEGKIIGYGSLWIDEGTTDWQTINIPINYYEQTAKPTDGNYSLVISCACNAYGDYFNGCSTNEMSVDNFQWVY